MLIIMFCSHIIYKDVKGWPFLTFQDVAKVTNLFFLFFLQNTINEINIINVFYELNCLNLFL